MISVDYNNQQAIKINNGKSSAHDNRTVSKIDHWLIDETFEWLESKDIEDPIQNSVIIIWYTHAIHNLNKKANKIKKEN